MKRHGPDGRKRRVMTHQSRTVVIAVLTYHRNEDLPVLLPLLVEQSAAVPNPTRILVVDNDPAAGAAPVVESLALPGVRYVVEPAPGIAAARNRVLDECGPDDLLVFIDDDERPLPGWLEALLDCHRRYRCAAVAGAVVPDVDSVEDDWLVAGGFFVRLRHRTGTQQVAASTANLLLDLAEVQRLGAVRFDERFGLTGGSDTMFTRTLVHRGGRIVWCDEAVVVDHVRPERLTRSWVLQRHYRSGNSGSRISVELQDGPWSRLGARLERSCAGLTRIAVGVTRMAAGTVAASARHQARGSRTMSRGLGMLTGAWGGVYDEYGRSRHRRGPARQPDRLQRRSGGGGDARG